MYAHAYTTTYRREELEIGPLNFKYYTPGYASNDRAYRDLVITLRVMRGSYMHTPDMDNNDYNTLYTRERAHRRKFFQHQQQRFKWH